MRLLDIGCGWGSLLSLAAERHDIRAIGVTLSQRQADEANRRARRAGLGERVSAHVLDYRDMAGLGRFDAVASVGMFEHVGRANLPTYFRAAFDALEPGGLFLNHGIAGSGPRRRPSGLRPRGNRFLQRYVFPDGELVAIEDAVGFARAAGFEVIDVQSLRPHYALTLAAWIERLEASWPTAVEAAGDEVARTWRLYMSAARLGFERGELDVCQLLLAKPAKAGRPRSRSALGGDDGQAAADRAPVPKASSPAPEGSGLDRRLAGRPSPAGRQLPDGVVASALAAASLIAPAVSSSTGTVLTSWAVGHLRLDGRRVRRGHEARGSRTCRG